MIQLLLGLAAVLATGAANALTINYSVKHDSSSMQSSKAKDDVFAQQILNPEILALIKTLQENTQTEFREDFQMEFIVGNPKSPRIGMHQPSENLLAWTYPSSVSHPRAHRIALILPEDNVDPAKVKRALVHATLRSLFYEQMETRFPRSNLYVSPVRFEITIQGESKSVENETMKLREAAPSRFNEGMELLFAYSVARLVGSESDQAALDSYMEKSMFKATYKGLVTLGQQQADLTAAIAAIREVLEHSFARAIRVSSRWPKRFWSVEDAEAQWTGEPIRKAIITAVEVNLRARHGIKNCDDLLL